MFWKSSKYLAENDTRLSWNTFDGKYFLFIFLASNSEAVVLIF